MRIGIVGPCAAGKTTLARGLLALGYDAHDIAQEHSQMQAMWEKVTRPDLLIYLDASRDTICERLHVNWEYEYIDEQKRRLAHAREHAHLQVDTNLQTPGQVLAQCLEFLEAHAGPVG